MPYPRKLTKPQAVKKAEQALKIARELFEYLGENSSHILGDFPKGHEERVLIGLRMLQDMVTDPQDFRENFIDADFEEEDEHGEECECRLCCIERRLNKIENGLVVVGIGDWCEHCGDYAAPIAEVEEPMPVPFMPPPKKEEVN